jgi:hypothetical protein
MSYALVVGSGAKPPLCTTAPFQSQDELEESMSTIELILLLDSVPLLLTLAIAIRAPSRSAVFTIGVALGTCLAARDQVWRPHSTPVVFGFTMVLNALLLDRLVVVRRTRKPAYIPVRR